MAEITSTQVQNPWRTTLRSVVFVLISLAVAFPAMAEIVTGDLSEYLPGDVSRRLVYASGLWTSVLVAVQRIALIPSVASVIAKVPGMSALPKSPKAE